MHSEKIRVAVYGTLKQNQSNHWLLADQKRCGEFQCDLITLYDLGPFPAAKLSNSDGVRVEVYEVDDETFARLDELEGFNAESQNPASTTGSRYKPLSDRPGSISIITMYPAILKYVQESGYRAAADLHNG